MRRKPDALIGLDNQPTTNRDIEYSLASATPEDLECANVLMYLGLDSLKGRKNKEAGYLEA